VAYDELYDTGLYRQTLLFPAQRAAIAGSALEQTHEPFFKRVPLFGERRLLEIACGTGRFSFEAAKRGWSCVACDTSVTAIAVARQAFGGTVEFQVAEALTAPEGPFDVIAAVEFLEHHVKPVDIVQSMVVRAKTGGTIFVTVPNWGSRGVRESTDPAWTPPIHLQFFTRRSLRHLFTRVAAIDESTIRVGFIPPITSIFPLAQYLGNQPDGLWALARVI